MSLERWADSGWLRAHQTSRDEIANLFTIVDRDLSDAEGGISADWRFGIAYNAALKLCTILLYASGFRAERQLQHYRTIQALPLILGPDRTGDAEYLDACRKKRNIVEYDHAGSATDAEAEELISFVRDFRDDVQTWLIDNHPELI
jgi:hypothetical protein